MSEILNRKFSDKLPKFQIVTLIKQQFHILLRCGRIYLFQQSGKFFLHVLVDVAVAGEGSAAFGVDAENTDKIRGLDFTYTGYR